MNFVPGLHRRQRGRSLNQVFRRHPVHTTPALIALCCLLSLPANALDLSALWDFKDPVRSEANFHEALRTASGDDAVILRTQIARTYTLRGKFGTAREHLRDLEPDLRRSRPEAVIRYWLEVGRTYASHRHPPGSITESDRDTARASFSTALDLARAAHFDSLAIDAIHMFAFVDTDPADQVTRGRQALALAQSSTQLDARRWEPSIRSNLGEALFDLGRYDEALDQFRAALSLRNRTASTTSYRDNEWHIARALRAQDRIAEALAMQLRLLHESESEGEHRYYIYDELAQLFEAKGDRERASHFRGLSAARRRK